LLWSKTVVVAAWAGLPAGGVYALLAFAVLNFG